MKKIRRILAVSLALVMILTSTAFAAVPNNSIIIGNKAISIDYIFSHPEEAQSLINGLISSNPSVPIFIQMVDQFDNFTNPFTGIGATEEDLASVEKYVNENGEEQDVAPAQLAVTSVSAINGRQVEVTFNKAIKRVTAETATNYELKSVSGTAVGLDSVAYVAENKVVLSLAKNNVNYTLDEALTNGTEYELTVKKDLQGADGKALAADQKVKFTFTDSTLPAIEKVTTLGIREIQIDFTEPVRPANATLGAVENNYSLKALDKDGLPTGTELIVAGDSVTYLGADRKSVKITLATNALTAGVKYNLSLNTATAANESFKLRDYAGYMLPSTSQVIQYTVDATIPQVTNVKVISQGAVEVSFSKPVTAIATNFYWNTDGVETNDAKKGSGITPLDAQTVRVDFGTNLMPAGTIYLFAKDVVDYNGNKIATTKTTLTVADDLKPAVTSAKLTSKSTIEVEFNTSLTSEARNFTLKNAAGQLVAFTLSTNTASKKHTLTTATLQDGTYTLVVSGIKDSLNREIDTFTQTLEVAGVTTLTKKVATAYSNKTEVSTNDSVVIAYDKGLAVSGDNSALGLDKWIVTTKTGDKALSEISGASVEAIAGSDNKAFLIKLPVESLAPSINVTIQNVKDAAGKQVQPLTIYGISTKTAANNVDLSAASAKVTAKRTIEVEVNELLSSVAAADFDIKKDGTSVSFSNVEYTNNFATGKSTVKFTLSEDAVATSTYSVSTRATVTSTKDIFGAKFKANVGIAAPFSVKDSIDKAFVTGANTITLVLKESASITGALIVDSDFTVKNAAGNDVAIATTGVGTPIGGKATITLTTTPTVSADQAYTITVKEAGLSKINGNPLAAGTVTTTAGLTATKLEFGAGASATAINGDETITITFSESINPASIRAGWTGAEEVKTVNLDADTEKIDIPNVGTVVFNKDGVVKTGTTLATAKIKVSENNKLVITLVGATDANLANVASAIATFTPAGTLTTIDGRPVSPTVTPQASVDGLVAAKTITIAPSSKVDNTFVVTNNHGATVKDDGSEVAIKTNADMTGTDVKTVGVNGVKLTAAHASGVVTVGVDGTAKTPSVKIDKGTKWFVQVEVGSVKSNVLTIEFVEDVAATTGEVKTTSFVVKY